MTLGSKFDDDVNNMQEAWWIDEKTRLAQYGCRINNANTNQNFLVMYSVEITAAGWVYPMSPLISSEILMRNIKDSITGQVNALLLLPCITSA